MTSTLSQDVWVKSIIRRTRLPKLVSNILPSKLDIPYMVLYFLFCLHRATIKKSLNTKQKNKKQKGIVKCFLCFFPPFFNKLISYL